MVTKIKFLLFVSVVFLFSLPLHVQSAEVEKGKATYVGSETCKSCHQKYYEGWKKTLHSKMEQQVIKEGNDKTVLGDFSITDPDLTFTLNDVNMLVGSRFKQRYAKSIDGEYYLLPAQWNVQQKEWVQYKPKKDWWAAAAIYPEDWDKRPYSKLCRGCHSTGIDVTTGKPAEQNIACEACHGPGSLHIEQGGKGHIVNPVKLNHERGAMVCFRCHMSGRPPKGDFEKYAWAVGYMPGEDLKQYWGYDKPKGENSYEFWAGGYAAKNRVQGNTFIQSKMYREGMNCFTCHDPHSSRHMTSLIKSGDTNSLCILCHGENSHHAVYKSSISEHTHHKADSAGSRCIECHTPKTGTNAVKWDARDHTFKFISPMETIKAGTPNACANCHKDQTPEWAQKTVTEWLLK
jgi:predicted CXXCH cytochrome family protein